MLFPFFRIFFLCSFSFANRFYSFELRWLYHRFVLTLTFSTIKIFPIWISLSLSDGSAMCNIFIQRFALLFGSPNEARMHNATIKYVNDTTATTTVVRAVTAAATTSHYRTTTLCTSRKSLFDA